MREPKWIVNDMGELGVEVDGLCFFLYKGSSIEYEDGTHDDGTPILYRGVGKQEFGETQLPRKWVESGRREPRYTEKLVFIEGLSFGKPEDCDWKPLPSQAYKNPEGCMQGIDGWTVLVDQLTAVHVWPANGPFVAHEVEYLRKNQHYSLREKDGLISVWCYYPPDSPVQGADVLVGIYGHPARVKTIPF